MEEIEELHSLEKFNSRATEQCSLPYAWKAETVRSKRNKAGRYRNKKTCEIEDGTHQFKFDGNRHMAGKEKRIHLQGLYGWMCVMKYMYMAQNRNFDLISISKVLEVMKFEVECL